MKSSLGPEPPSQFPSTPVSVPLSDPSSGVSSPHLLSRKGALQPRASQRHRGSVKGRGPRPPDSPRLVSSLPLPGRDSVGPGGPPGAGETEPGAGAVGTMAAVAARGLVSEPLPWGVALTLVFGVPRSPLPEKLRPTPRCLPQVSERPCLLLGGARVALPEDTAPLPSHQTADPPGAMTTSGNRLRLPPAGSGPEKRLRLRGGSPSGSELLLSPTCQC